MPRGAEIRSVLYGRSFGMNAFNRMRRTTMKALVMGALLAVAGTLGIGVDVAWAQAKVNITREESKPNPVAIKAGETVQFINNTGGTAHVMFAGNDAYMFYVGKSESRIKFEKPGTYEYTVHVSGTKVHAHTGSVLVR
jgi:plastocyanin